MMPITGNNFIGFSRSAIEKNYLRAVDPLTGQNLPEKFVSASSEEIELGMHLATKASITYRKMDGAAKATFLDAIADEILALGDELVDRAVLETALPPARIMGERGRTVGQLRLFANLIREGSWCEPVIEYADPDRQPLPKPDIRRMLMAMGPVVVFAASNFPLAFSTAGGDTASALAGGNPVIVKAHSSHMGTSELVASAIIAAARKAGMPEGVFSMVFGDGQTVGQHLIQHPSVKAAAFTGSQSAGRLLFDLATRRPNPIPFFAEMGSLNPVLLCSDALRKRGVEIARDFAASVTLGCGQFCTKPGLFFAQDSPELNAFIRDFAASMEKTRPVTMLNPKIHRQFTAGRNQALEQPGVQALAYSEAAADLTAHEGQPTLFVISAEDFMDNPTLRHEIFGPYALVVRCPNKTQMAAALEALEGQLTATVIAENEEMEDMQMIIDLMIEKAGRVIHNGVPTGVEVCSAMQHGGPYPAATDARFTSVGSAAIKRFARPVSFQDWPQALLPDELKNGNPLKVWRLVNNEMTNA